MIKKRGTFVWLFFAITFVIVVVVFVGNNRFQYLKNKKRVLEYANLQYDKDKVELVDTRMGKNAWPSGRQEDEFVFRDLTNNFYFQIICADDDLIDYYMEAHDGMEVSEKVVNELASNKFKYYIRCFGQKTTLKPTTYEGFYGQLFVLANNKEDISAAYEIVKFMNDNFSGLELKLMIVPYYVEDIVINLFEYKERIAIADIDNYYNVDLKLNNTLFFDENMFLELLSKEQKE